MEKFTINSSKRIQETQDMANKNGNSSISPLHLLLSILTAPDSLVKEILLEAGVDIQLLAGNVRKAVDALPKVS